MSGGLQKLLTGTLPTEFTLASVPIADASLQLSHVLLKGYANACLLDRTVVLPLSQMLLSGPCCSQHCKHQVVTSLQERSPLWHLRPCYCNPSTLAAATPDLLPAGCRM